MKLIRSTSTLSEFFRQSPLMGFNIDLTRDKDEKFDLKDYVQNPVALARIRAHLTQESLASHLQVTQAYISKIENQESVSPIVLTKMLKAIKEYKKQVLQSSHVA